MAPIAEISFKYVVETCIWWYFYRISRDFADLPEFRGSATARNIRSPDPGQTAKRIKSVEEMNWPWPLNITTFQGGAIVGYSSAQTSRRVNLVFSRQTGLFECEHPLIDKPIFIVEPAVPSAELSRLRSILYPSKMSRMLNKILLDSCRVLQNRASERKALLAGCGYFKSLTRFTHSLLISSYLRKRRSVRRVPSP